MSGTIFDLLQPEIPEGEEALFEIAKNAPQPKDNSFFNDLKDYSKTILKGTLEGTSRLGKMMGPLKDISREKPKTQKQELEQQTENLDLLLPTDEKFGQTAIRRGLREAPSMMAFPGSSPIQAFTRTMLGSAAAEGIKESELFPQWVESAAEITAFLGPDITKKLLEKGSKKELIETGKRLGMTDEQLTPLLQSDFRQKWLKNFVPRRGGLETKLAESKKGVSNAYSEIYKSKAAETALTKESADAFLKEVSPIFHEMPNAVRNKIKDDFRDLLNSKATGKDLMNFFSDINHYLGENTKQLSRLKEPIRKALHSINPQLAEDFKLVNDLNSKFHKINNALKPNLKTDIAEGVMSVIEPLSAASVLLTGNYIPLITIAGEKSARIIAKQMLTNPRFQQMGLKMADALNKNKFQIAVKTINEFANEIRKTSPELAKELEKLSVEDFEKAFSQE